MFIVLAAVPIIRTRSTGHFHCYRCREGGCPYSLKTQQVWFAFFFLPIFPLGFKTWYVECDRCFATFGIEVLDAEPPTRDDYFLSDCREGLARGWALETVEADMAKAGHTPAFAKEWLAENVRSNVWECRPCGLHYHADAVLCLKCGSRKLAEPV